MPVRIQKILSAAGIASRRAVERMIAEGRITVNAEVVTALPCFVEPSDEILVDGQQVRKRPQKKVYILLNKPRGVICTAKDEHGFSRPKATDLVPPMGERIYCVGRLDADSTGVILLTNDGELTQRLTHPSFGVVKTYIVRVEGGTPTQAQLEALRRGVFLGGRRTGGADAKVIQKGAQEAMLEVRLPEAGNREIRLMLLQLGFKVRRLHRSAIGPIDDRGVKIGRFRYLSPDEVSELQASVGMAEHALSSPKRPTAKPPVPAALQQRRRSGRK
jgi:23S rRNA pseudouridine2605 synthase